jgi:hypothetical protein
MLDEDSGKAGAQQIDTPDDPVADMHVNVKTVQVQGSEQWTNALLSAPPKSSSKNMIIIYVMCIAPFLCGTVSGYDSSVMGSFLVESSFQTLFGGM